MRVYDISVGIDHDLPVWPGDPPVVLDRVQSMDAGDIANVSRFGGSVHVGTHVDAPLHFIQNGKSIDSIPIKSLIGRAYVVHLPRVDSITEEVLEKASIPPRTRRILFRTKNSRLWIRGGGDFHTDFVAIEESGARWLVRKGVQLVGIDYLSVAPYGDSAPTHRILLEAGVVIVEGLDLSAVTQGRYTIYCLPLKLIGIEGAPARAILVGV
jgi:arylformamidase